MHVSSLHSLGLLGESHLMGSMGVGGGVWRVGIHHLEIRFRWKERTTAVTTASLWMARSSTGSWKVLKTVLGSQLSTLLASCYTSPQGSSSFDAGQETRRLCRKCAARQQLTGVWVRSWVRAKGLSGLGDCVDRTLVMKLAGIAVSSQTRTCSQCCLHRVEKLPKTTCICHRASDLWRETAGGKTASEWWPDGGVGFGLKTWQ